MNKYRDKKDGKIIIHYWVDGDQLWKCKFKWFRGDLLIVENSERLVHKCASAIEAQRAFIALRDVTLRDKKIKKKKESKKC